MDQKKRTEPKCPLTDIASEACQKTKGDTTKGALLLLKILLTQWPDYYAETSERVMLYWAQDQIKGARSRWRNHIASAPTGHVPKSHQSLSSQTLESSADSWLNWPVIPGVLLRDATRVELFQMAHKYLGDAETYTRRGKWLLAIAKALPDDHTRVAQVLDEEKVDALARKFKVSIEKGE